MSTAARCSIVITIQLETIVVSCLALYNVLQLAGYYDEIITNAQGSTVPKGRIN